MQAFNHSSLIQYNQGYFVVLIPLFNVITQILGRIMDQELTALINIQLSICNRKLKHNKISFSEQ